MYVHVAKFYVNFVSTYIKQHYSFHLAHVPPEGMKQLEKPYLGYKTEL